MKNISQNSFQYGEIRSLLFARTIPMVFGIFSMIAFNLVDTYFISKLGIIPLAAISFTFPVVFVISSFTLGLGAGSSAVISHAIGEGDSHKVQRFATDSIILALLLTCIFCLVGFLAFKQIFMSLGASGEILDLVREYMFIWYWGMICVVIPMVGNNIIRATGDTKTPGMLMCLAILINIILDPLLIFGLGPFPRMGLAGAAIATVISRAITFVIVLWVLISKYKLISFERLKLSILFASWSKILYIGIPNAFTNITIPLGVGILTKLMSQYGPEAVAAFGVTSRIKSFAFIVIFSLATVLGPFIGQNWGAGKVCRAYSGVRDSQIFALLWGAAMALVLAIFAGPIAYIFTDDKRVVDIVVLYLRIVPLGYGLHGLLTLSNTALTVLHRPFHALMLNVFYMFVLCLPLAYLGAGSIGIMGIFAGATAAKIIAGTSAYYWIKRVFHKESQICEV